MKRFFIVLLCFTLAVCTASCMFRADNPTVSGGEIWVNSGDTRSDYDVNETYTLNYNVADALAVQSVSVDAEQVELAAQIISSLNMYPSFSDDENINYIIKLRELYKCVVGFYYKNSTEEQLTNLIEEYHQSYYQMSNKSKAMYTEISAGLFSGAAEQFANFGDEQNVI